MSQEYALNDFFRGQADVYKRADEKPRACGCLSYRVATKYIGVWNIILLLGYIARCIIAEGILTEHLEVKEKALKPKLLAHDYTAIFALIEVLSFVGQAYTLFVFFRWTRNNDPSTRAALPWACFIQAGFNMIVCALVYSYFSHPKVTDIDGESQQIMDLWYGKMSWVLCCINLMSFHYCKEFETEYKNVEDMDDQQSTRVRLMVDRLWDQFDENNDQMLSRIECRKFIRHILREGDELNDERFNVLFDDIDTDKSNTIDRNEMTVFVQSLYADQGEPEQQKDPEQYTTDVNASGQDY